MGGRRRENAAKLWRVTKAAGQDTKVQKNNRWCQRKQKRSKTPAAELLAKGEVSQAALDIVS